MAHSHLVLGMLTMPIVVNSGSEVLVIRHLSLSSSDLGCLELSGGKTGDRKLPAATLAREVREETGLIVLAAEGRPFHVSLSVNEPFWITCATFASARTTRTMRNSEVSLER